MPHDKNGVELKKGDEVLMRMKVLEVYPQQEACNVTLEAIGGPKHEYHPQLTCNTRLVEKIEQDAPDPEKASGS